MLASERGHAAIVSLLREKGANASAMNNKGETALNLAKSHGQSHIVELLKSQHSMFLQG